MEVVSSFHNVGRSVTRLEARAKVSGRTEYVHHLKLPGMLYGKIHRSTKPHARIVSVDTSEAKAVEGVFRVVTVVDIRSVIPHPYYGPAFHDQPISRTARCVSPVSRWPSCSRPTPKWPNTQPD